MERPSRFSVEVRPWAVRMVLKPKSGHHSQ